jgi:hypothetical protein
MQLDSKMAAEIILIFFMFSSFRFGEDAMNMPGGTGKSVIK